MRKRANIHPTQQTTTEAQMQIYERDFEGYKLVATYEYEAADHEVIAPAIYTVVSLSINDSPFCARHQF